MSISDATLFYSRYDKKSSEMKQIVDALNIDMELITVDNRKVKQMLERDTRCNINEVPTVVVNYTDGGNKIYTGRKLDTWFQQLLSNIQSQQEPEVPEQAYTPLTEPSQPVAVEGFGSQQTPLDTSDTQFTSLIDAPIPSGPPNVGSGMDTNAAPMQQALAAQHIIGSGSNIEADPNVQPGRKEVKKEGISAAELAKQMAQQRESHDEQVDKNRPFM